MKSKACFTNVLTIIMPVYERFLYFEESLDSALSQSQNCKVIVVDSGSSHDKFKNSVARKNLPLSHLEYIRYESNHGMFANWNRASTLSRSMYTYILGDDDILSPHFVYYFLRALDIFHCIDLYIAKPVLFSDKYVKNYYCPYPRGMNTLGQLKANAALCGLSLSSISTIYKTSVLRSFPFLDSPFASMDWLMLYSLPDNYSAYVDPHITVAYRKHEAASTSNIQSYLLFTLSHSYIFSGLQHNFYAQKNYIIALSAFLRKHFLIVSLFLRDPRFLSCYETEQDDFLASYIGNYKFLLIFLRSRPAFICFLSSDRDRIALYCKACFL